MWNPYITFLNTNINIFKNKQTCSSVWQKTISILLTAQTSVGPTVTRHRFSPPDVSTVCDIKNKSGQVFMIVREHMTSVGMYPSVLLWLTFLMLIVSHLVKSRNTAVVVELFKQSRLTIFHVYFYVVFYGKISNIGTLAFQTLYDQLFIMSRYTG